MNSRKPGLQGFIGGPGQAGNIQNAKGLEVRKTSKGQVKGNMGSKNLMRDLKKANHSFFLMENVIAKVSNLGLVTPACMGKHVVRENINSHGGARIMNSSAPGGPFKFNLGKLRGPRGRTKQEAKVFGTSCNGEVMQFWKVFKEPCFSLFHDGVEGGFEQRHQDTFYRFQ